MTQIVFDAELRNKLHGLTQQFEVCDESGRVVGRFYPVPDLSQYEPLEPQVSDEELRRREPSTEWYSTAKVLAHLEKQ